MLKINQAYSVFVFIPAHSNFNTQNSCSKAKCFCQRRCHDQQKYNLVNKVKTLTVICLCMFHSVHATSVLKYTKFDICS